MLYVFRALRNDPWVQALSALSAGCLERKTAEVGEHYAALYAALAEAGHADLFTAAATSLRFSASPLADTAPNPPAGLLTGARHDLTALLTLLGRDWHAEATEITDAELPPLTGLADNSADAGTAALAELLRAGELEPVWTALLTSYRAHGGGDLARYPAFRWSGNALRGVLHPDWPDAARLVGVDGPLGRLYANTEAFLAGRGAQHGAQHALLYGPRGSGKSTALRSLGGRYADAGLRLVEVAPDALGALPEISEQLRGRPHRYLIFTDDLSFEAGSSAYGPLKSLLEGSLTARPENVLVYATSNRRHLVPERFSDRPDPLSADVHAWDTQHERLALADRFGLVITFPDATQRRYLEIVRGLAERDGIQNEGLEERAIRFAEWGNGYSGRTAEQFVRALKSGLA